MHADMPYLREVILFLAAAGLLMPIARKLKISPVLGFLCIGMIVGPYGLGRIDEHIPVVNYFVISDLGGVRALGEFGIVFLLFSIGLDMSGSQIWGMRAAVFGLGSAQILLSSAVIGLILWTIGLDTTSALLIGPFLALSSTAIIMQLLSEGLRLSTQIGRTTFGILLMQDLAVVPILIFVGSLGANHQGSLAIEMLLSLGEAAATVAAIFLGGRVIVRPVLQLAGGSGSREIFMAAVLLLIIGTSVLTALIGLSMALGAFLAGLLFAGTEYRHQIKSDVEPFKGLLLALFFISVGMRLDLATIRSDLGGLVAAAIALLAIKAAVLFLLCHVTGRPTAVSAETAILLSGGGEFAIVGLTVAMSSEVIAPHIARFAILVVVTTMFATPFLEGIGHRVGARLAGALPHDGVLPTQDAASERIVIGGFGRVGKTLAKILEDQQVSCVAFDTDAELVAREAELGSPVHYGDVGNIALLRNIGVDQAVAVLLTMDRRGTAEQLVPAVRSLAPHVPIFACARDPEHAHHLRRLGVQQAIPESTEVSLQLSEAVLLEIGVPENATKAIVDRERETLLLSNP